jgi:hypothetical protein
VSQQVIDGTKAAASADLNQGAWKSDASRLNVKVSSATFTRGILARAGNSGKSRRPFVAVAELVSVAFIIASRQLLCLHRIKKAAGGRVQKSRTHKDWAACFR